VTVHEGGQRRSNADVAGQRQLEASRGGHAIDHAYDGLGEFGQHIEEMHRHAPAGGDVPEIDAGAECGVGPRYHEHFQPGIGRTPVNCLLELERHGLRYRVADVGRIEPDPQHMLPGLVDDDAHGDFCSAGFTPPVNQLSQTVSLRRHRAAGAVTDDLRPGPGPLAPGPFRISGTRWRTFLRST
jgi:hypothetical protein